MKVHEEEMTKTCEPQEYEPSERKRQVKNIIFQNYSFNSFKNPQKRIITGCDTETVRGKAFLMNVFDGYEHYTHEIKTFEDFLDNYFKREFMLSLNFFHNLEYDYQAILKHLSISDLKFIAKYDKIYYLIDRRGNIVTTNSLNTNSLNPKNETLNNRYLKGYEISIIPKRLFKISEIKLNDANKIQYSKISKTILLKPNKLCFYDLAQFYNFKSLEYLAEKYNCKTQKYKINDIENINLEKFYQDEVYKKEIIKRIRTDSEITHFLAQKIYENIWKIQPTNRLFSIASVSEEILKRHLAKHNIPKFILQKFLYAYAGGRFECFQRGYFNHIYEIDINSAYPCQISKLALIDNRGFWHKTTKYNPEVLYGVYLIKIKINEPFISPIKFNAKTPLPFPNGNFKTWIDKNELELLIDFDFDFEIIEGYEYFNPEPEYPFKEIINNLYKQKNKLKHSDEELYNTIKIIINGMYGKFIQLKPLRDFKKIDFIEDIDNTEFSELIEEVFFIDNVEHAIFNHKFKTGLCFNPVYASFITSGTRCKLYRDCVNSDNLENLIGFQTDSIIFNNKPSNFKISDKLGEYDFKKKNVNGIVLGSGICQIGNETKFRGFTTNINLIKELQNNKNKGNKIKFEIKRFSKLKECCIQKELTCEMINIPRFVNRELNLNHDKKRIWFDEFKNTDEVFEKVIYSKPVEIIC